MKKIRFRCPSYQPGRPHIARRMLPDPCFRCPSYQPGRPRSSLSRYRRLCFRCPSYQPGRPRDLLVQLLGKRFRCPSYQPGRPLLVEGLSALVRFRCPSYQPGRPPNGFEVVCEPGFRCPSYQPGRPPKLKCKFDRKPSALRHAYNRLRRKSRENRCVSHPPFECAAVTTACFRLSESCRQIHIIKFSSAYLQLLPGFMPANCRIGGSFSCYRRILAKFICFNRKFPIFISH